MQLIWPLFFSTPMRWRLSLTHKQIQAAFAHPDLHIFSDAKKLEAFLQARRRSHAVLALMSSGSFKGLELEGL